MSELQIQLQANEARFHPGDILQGTVSWNFPQASRALELRLFWFTQGKGTPDSGVVEKLRFDRPVPIATHPFQFTLPQGPYSFSGQLISLTWALELVSEPGKEVARQEIVIAPEGKEIELPSIPVGGRRGVWTFLGRTG